MFKIDINIRWLVALLADKAFEEEIVGRGIDLSDAENIADRAVGR